MQENNFTDVQKYILLLFFPEALGKPDAVLYESMSMWSHLVPPELEIPENLDNVTVTEIIGAIWKHDLALARAMGQMLVTSSKMTLAQMDLEPSDLISTGNVGLAAGGLYIAGVSSQSYFRTNNTLAKICYGASVCCSGSAAISGTIKAFGSVSGISYLAIGGDAFGTSFLFLGNRARDLGDLAQGKSKIRSLNPFRNLRNRSFRRAPISKGSDSLAFLTGSSWSSKTSFSEILTTTSFQKIILVGGSIFTVYAYGKFVISTYHYGQKLISKRRKIKASKLVIKQASFVVNSFTETPYFYYYRQSESVLRIYKLALSSQVL